MSDVKLFEKTRKNETFLEINEIAEVQYTGYSHTQTDQIFYSKKTYMKMCANWRYYKKETNNRLTFSHRQILSLQLQLEEKRAGIVFSKKFRRAFFAFKKAF